MINDDKMDINFLYPTYHRLVKSVCWKFLKRLPGEELEDLTQTAWEQIVRKYHGYEEGKASLSTWITIVARSAMFDMLKANQRDKRVVQNVTISLDGMMDGKDKYL